MKKLLAALSVICIILSLAACGNTASTAPPEDTSGTITDVLIPETSDTSTVEPETTADPSVPDETEAPYKSSAKQTQSNSTSPQKTDNSKTQSTSNSKPNEKKPESSQAPTKTDPPEETPKSAFAKPFDVATMKSALIAYGKSIGMTHITNFSEDFGGGQVTPEGTTWLPPHETWMYDSSSAGKLKQDLCDRIKRWKNNDESTFTLWFEKDSKHSGDYIIYVIIG